MQNTRHAGKIFVDSGDLRHVVDEPVECCVKKASAHSRLKELRQLVSVNVNAKLHRMVAGSARDVVLKLVSASNVELRQVDAQTDGGAARSGVESEQPEFVDLERGDGF